MCRRIVVRRQYENNCIVSGSQGKIENTKSVAIPPYGIGLNVVTQEWCETDL